MSESDLQNVELFYTIIIPSLPWVPLIHVNRDFDIAYGAHTYLSWIYLINSWIYLDINITVYPNLVENCFQTWNRCTGILILPISLYNPQINDK